jgi:UDP-N-acetyl-D-glucosamine dehydrogenase
VESFKVGGNVFLREVASINRVPLTEETLAAADCAAIITDHSNLDYNWIAQHSQLLFDSRNVTSAKNINQPNIVRLGAP